MNESKINCGIRILDDECKPCPIDDLRIALELVERNKQLIEDYPSLEKVIKTLVQIIND